MIDISVIVPVYNVEKYLSTCLDSILRQTFNNFEVICVNDGSTDKSGEILSRYAKKDDRIHIISQINQGVSVARNRGLAQARGNYIAFVDSDDEIAPTFLEDLYILIKMKRADIACCGYQTEPKFKGPCEPPQIQVSNTPFASLISGENQSPMAVWNKLYKHDILKGLSFIPHQSLGEDIIFLFQSVYAAQKIVSVSSPLYFYRTRSDSAMKQVFSQNQIDNNVRISLLLDRYFKDKPLAKQDRTLLNQKIAKRIFKFCVLEPKRKDKAHLQKWYDYSRSLLKDLYQKGEYNPRYLSFKNRFKSWLFLRGKNA